MFDFFRKKNNGGRDGDKGGPDGASRSSAGEGGAADPSDKTTRDVLAEFTAAPLPDAVDGLLFRVSMAEAASPASGFEAYAARLLSDADSPSQRAIPVAPSCASSRCSTAWPLSRSSWRTATAL